MAYADYNDLMDMTETLIAGLVHQMNGSYELTYHAHGPDKDPVVINCTPPFQRVSMIKGLEEKTLETFPKDLSSEEANGFVAEICVKHKVECPPPRTTARMLDKLVGHFLEADPDFMKKPMFIMDHPEIMSPLAKYHRSVEGLTERFELFMCGKVCVRVCMCVCVYVCVHVCVCVCMYVCMCVCVCMYVCMYVYVYVCMCMCICVGVGACVYV